MLVQAVADKGLPILEAAANSEAKFKVHPGTSWLWMGPRHCVCECQAPKA